MKPSLHRFCHEGNQFRPWYDPAYQVWLWPAPFCVSVQTIEDYLHDKKDRQEQTLKNALFPIDSDYDYIIIDCPTNGYRIKENMHVYTDYLILVTIPDDNALQGLLCIAKDLLDIKRNYNSPWKS